MEGLLGFTRQIISAGWDYDISAGDASVKGQRARIALWRGVVKGIIGIASINNVIDADRHTGCLTEADSECDWLPLINAGWVSHRHTRHNWRVNHRYYCCIARRSGIGGVVAECWVVLGLDYSDYGAIEASRHIGGLEIGAILGVWQGKNGGLGGEVGQATSEIGIAELHLHLMGVGEACRRGVSENAETRLIGGVVFGDNRLDWLNLHHWVVVQHQEVSTGCT